MRRQNKLPRTVLAVAEVIGYSQWTFPMPQSICSAQWGSEYRVHVDMRLISLHKGDIAAIEIGQAASVDASCIESMLLVEDCIETQIE